LPPVSLLIRSIKTSNAEELEEKGWSMISIRLAVGLVACLFAVGCANPVLVKVSYDKPVNVVSQKTCWIQLFTGIVEGSGGTTFISGGSGIFVPISTGPYPQLHFNLQDQRVFIESLRDELNRLGVLRVTKISEQKITGTEVSIQVVFVQTSHNPQHQEYFLNVAMQLEAGGKTSAKRYEVISSEGDSIWTKMNTNAAEGKEKAARKLMAKLIPDIEQFVGALK
jgi:hypothetical protein